MHGFRNLSEEDREQAAKTLFMTGIEVTLKTCKEMELGSSATLVGLVETVTYVIRQLFQEIREED